MSTSRWLFVLVAPVLFVIAASAEAFAQQADKPKTKSAAEALLAEGDKLADKKDYDGALIKYKDAYETLVADLRGLKFRQGVKPKLMSRPELQKRMVKMFAEEFTEEELYEMDRTYKVFRFAPASMDIKKTMTDLLTEEVAGYYDPKTKDLVLIKEEDDPKRKKGFFEKIFGGGSTFDKDETKITLAHEMTHALQDQHFDLEAMDKAMEHDDDMTLAFTALVEGEATLVMFAEMFREDRDPRQILKMKPARMDLVFSTLRMALPFGSGKTFRKAPLILRESLIFPYHKGTVFVLHLTNRSGWKLVDKAFREPPLSTEQILHPEKYHGQRDDPVEIKLPDLATAAGDTWKRIGGNVLGEFQTLVLLTDVKGANVTASRAAAAGWDGDQYVVLENKEKQLGLVWLTTWDSQKDAEEFATVYGQRIATKLKLTNTDGKAGSAEEEPEPIVRFQRDGRIYHVERREQDVAVVEGFDGETTKRLVDAAFTAKKSVKRFVRPEKSKEK